jgi:hypothetical protein
MEKLLRNMRWFNGMKSGEPVDWKRYEDWLHKERDKYEEMG